MTKKAGNYLSPHVKGQGTCLTNIPSGTFGISTVTWAVGIVQSPRYNSPPYVPWRTLQEAGLGQQNRLRLERIACLSRIAIVYYLTETSDKISNESNRLCQGKVVLWIKCSCNLFPRDRGWINFLWRCNPWTSREVRTFQRKSVSVLPNSYSSVKSSFGICECVFDSNVGLQFRCVFESVTSFSHSKVNKTLS